MLWRGGSTPDHAQVGYTKYPRPLVAITIPLSLADIVKLTVTIFAVSKRVTIQKFKMSFPSD